MNGFATLRQAQGERDTSQKMSPGQPVVGATLVVALLLRQHIFIVGGVGGNRHERLLEEGNRFPPSRE